MKLSCYLFLFLLLLSSKVISQNSIYKDSDAPVEKRVQDLLSRMTLEEKVSQMMHQSPAIKRLDIPQYNWWNECLHGVARAGQATVFPQAIGMAATYDENLIYRVATAISDEARAKNNYYKSIGQRGYYQGLTYWSPNINIFRDPRWGRGMETYGEDPFLTGTIGVQFIKGLQGNNPNYFKLIATPKHYVVHSGPEANRHEFDAVADLRDFYLTYLPAFEMAVKEANAQSVMCAYNRTNGDLCCGSDQLLKNVLRLGFGFKGYIVSDCDAIEDFYSKSGHKVVDTEPKAAALGVKSGTDLNCGRAYKGLLKAVKTGLISEGEIDNSLTRLLKARFQLGMFDDDSKVPYTSIPLSVVESKEHIQLALETARKSMVLLQNNNSLLPIKKSVKRVAVIGPNADDIEPLYANYNGFSKSPVTVLQGIKNKLPNAIVSYAKGCDLAPNLPSLVTIPSGALYSDKNCMKSGLVGEYFANDTLAGKAFLTRIDKQVDFNWWNDSPMQGLDAQNFSVRWSGYVKAPVTGDFYIGFQSAYMTMWVNDELIGTNHNVHAPNKTYKKLHFEAGKSYKLRLELKRHRGMAFEKLIWEVPNPNLKQQAIELASKSDVVVLCMGLSPLLEGEEMKVEVDGFFQGDRVSLDIPKVQTDLMKELKKLGKPMVLVLMNGSALSINWEKENIPAILEAWYPGQQGGNAVADILFGDYNPGGRLPITFYKSVKDLPDFQSYSMVERTYRYFTKEPLWPFGFGLSYTQFEYSNLKTQGSLNNEGKIIATVSVKNTGKTDGDEVVQLYVKNLSGEKNLPNHTLAGFKRIHLSAGETREISFELDHRPFEQITDDVKRIVKVGDYEIFIGGSQPSKSSVSQKVGIPCAIVNGIYER
ncbi:MAG: glycoside hydrolase family 3 C-terminal domain-containing protein [Bacteroidota bacterium]|nr:glycoside hydrolase family 3 C-terminal domain-containing protein [Bacteroidota bacterium]